MASIRRVHLLFVGAPSRHVGNVRILSVTYYQLGLLAGIGNVWILSVTYWLLGLIAGVGNTRQENIKL